MGITIFGIFQNKPIIKILIEASVIAPIGTLIIGYIIYFIEIIEVSSLSFELFFILLASLFFLFLGLPIFAIYAGIGVALGTSLGIILGIFTIWLIDNYKSCRGQNGLRT